MKKRFGKTLANIYISLILVFSIFPIFWIFLTSFKERADVFGTSLFFKPNLNAYINIFTKHKDIILKGLLNSVSIALISTILVVIISIISGYTLSRLEFKGRKIILYFILGTRLMPPIVAILPLFVFFKNLGLIDTVICLSIIYTAFNLPLTIWMMKSFFDSVPISIEEAALIDGANCLQAAGHIVLPLVKPGIFAASMLCFLFSWNEFLFALIFSVTNARTAPVVLASVSYGEYEILWADMAAMASIMILPSIIFTYFAQNYLVRGLTAGSIK